MMTTDKNVRLCDEASKLCDSLHALVMIDVDNKKLWRARMRSYDRLNRRVNKTFDRPVSVLIEHKEEEKPKKIRQTDAERQAKRKKKLLDAMHERDLLKAQLYDLAYKVGASRAKTSVIIDDIKNLVSPEVFQYLQKIDGFFSDITDSESL